MLKRLFLAGTIILPLYFLMVFDSAPKNADTGSTILQDSTEYNLEIPRKLREKARLGKNLVEEYFKKDKSSKPKSSPLGI